MKQALWLDQQVGGCHLYSQAQAHHVAPPVLGQPALAQGEGISVLPWASTLDSIPVGAIGTALVAQACLGQED